MEVYVCVCMVLFVFVRKIAFLKFSLVEIYETTLLFLQLFLKRRQSFHFAMLILCRFK